MTIATTEYIEDLLKLSQIFLGLFNFLFHLAILIILLFSRRISKQKAIQLSSTVCFGHAYAGLATFALLFSERANFIVIAGLVQGNVGNLSKGFHIAAILPNPLIGALLTATEVLDDDVKTANFSVVVFLLAVLIVMAMLLFITNTLVYISLIRQRKEIRSMEVRNSPLQHSQQQQQHQQQHQRQPRHEKGRLESFYICLGYAFTFIVLWSPTAVYTINRINLYIHLKIPIKLPPPGLKFLFALNTFCDGMIVVLFNRYVKTKTQSPCKNF